MTITIEVDGKRVECSSEREARKTLAKAAREAKAAEAKREGYRAMAYLRAKAEGFRLLLAAQSVAEGQGYHWSICKADSASEYDRREWGRNVRHEGDRHYLKVETESGVGETWFYGHTIETLLVNGAGYLTAAEIVDETTRETVWFTFGVEQGEVVTECLRGSMAGDVHRMVATLLERRKAA